MHGFAWGYHLTCNRPYNSISNNRLETPCTCTCRFRGISADANAAQEAVGVIAVSLQVGNEP